MYIYIYISRMFFFQIKGKKLSNCHWFFSKKNQNLPLIPIYLESSIEKMKKKQFSNITHDGHMG